MTAAELRTHLREWIARKRGIPTDQVTDTVPLLEHRILSSLHVAELLVLIGELRERPVDIENLRPGNFRDLDTIIQVFFDDR